MSFSMLKYIPSKPINDNKLQEWLESHLNVMLVGLRGIGKTERILHIFNKNYENRWAYFNGATCDPWTDLIGIPTAEVNEKGEKVLKYIKPEELSGDIEGIYIDELNRAKTATRNALLELIQFHSINGRKFSNLKLVWSSINPSKEDGEDNDDNYNYDVEQLDDAIIDRFHIIVKLPSDPDLAFFSKKYNNVGVNLVEWWGQQPKEAKALISPRRLEYVAQAHLKKLDITDFLPICCNTKMLIKKINGNPTTNRYYELIDEKKQTVSIIKELHKLFNTENSFEELKNIIIKDKQWEMLDLVENQEKIDLIYKDHASKIESYYFSNFTTKGNLFEFLKKKIGNTDKFKQRIAAAVTNIKSDVSKLQVFIDRKITNNELKGAESQFKTYLNNYVEKGESMNTLDRRTTCNAIIDNFPIEMSSSTFETYLKFINLLVKKTQRSNRVAGNHIDGQYCQAFVNLAIEGCKIKLIDYKSQSFYSDMVMAKSDYFETGPNNENGEDENAPF